jgi:hypothetical protein
MIAFTQVVRRSPRNIQAQALGTDLFVSFVEQNGLKDALRFSFTSLQIDGRVLHPTQTTGVPTLLTTSHWLRSSGSILSAANIFARNRSSPRLSHLLKFAKQMTLHFILHLPFHSGPTSLKCVLCLSGSSFSFLLMHIYPRTKWLRPLFVRLRNMLPISSCFLNCFNRACILPSHVVEGKTHDSMPISSRIF